MEPARGWRPLACDLLPTLIVAAAGVLSAVAASAIGATPGGTLLWVGVALQTLATPILLLRRRNPFAVSVAVLAMALVLVAPWPFASGDLFPFFNQMDQWVPAAMVVIGSTAMPDLRGRRSVAAFAALALVSAVATRFWEPSLVAIAVGLVHTVTLALLGLYVTTRRRLLGELRERAERAERDRTAATERARAEERARMAAEMHDVVTHRLSLMVLQAGALRVTASDERTRTAAEELRDTGCRALEELRDMVGLLRGPLDGAERSAAPVEDLATLTAESASVGVPVDLIEEGDPAQISPMLRTLALRIVKEALTNVRKHAPGARVTMHLHHDGAGLRLSVRNAAPARSPDPVLAGSGTGAGLPGLRRRAGLVGGTLDARPTPDGGFEVTASLPGYVPSEPAARA